MFNTPPHPYPQGVLEIMHLFPCTWLPKSVCSELVAKEPDKKKTVVPFRVLLPQSWPYP